jgi:hypothetical protein
MSFLSKSFTEVKQPLLMTSRWMPFSSQNLVAGS